MSEEYNKNNENIVYVPDCLWKRKRVSLSLETSIEKENEIGATEVECDGESLNFFRWPMINRVESFIDPDGDFVIDGTPDSHVFAIQRPRDNQSLTRPRNGSYIIIPEKKDFNNLIIGKGLAVEFIGHLEIEGILHISKGACLMLNGLTVANLESVHV